MKIQRTTILAALLPAFFAATAAMAASHGEPGHSIKVGAAFSLSGDAAAWGSQERDGVLLALEEITRDRSPSLPKLELVIEDTTSSHEGTVRAVQKLIHVDKVQAIIGPTWLDSFRGAAPIAEQHHVQLLAPSALMQVVDPQRSLKYVRSTWFSPPSQIQALVNELTFSGEEQLAIIVEEDPYWREMAAQFRSQLVAKNIAIAEEHYVPPSVRDFAPLLIKLRARKITRAFFGFNQQALWSVFLKQRHSLFPMLQLCSDVNIENMLPDPGLSGFLNGISYVAPAPVQTDFAERFRRRFKREPGLSAGNAYDAARILIRALDENLRTGLSLDEAFHSLQFDSITFGHTRFGEDNMLQGGAFVVRAP